MLNRDKITITNYKCFDEQGATLEQILPINVIVGRNNSGKSSVLDVVEHLTTNKSVLSNQQDTESRTEIFIEHQLSEADIAKVFLSSRAHGGIPGQNHFEYGSRFVGAVYRYSLNVGGTKVHQELCFDHVAEAQKMVSDLAAGMSVPLNDKRYCKIAAERDVRPEAESGNGHFDPQGVGVTNAIQRILNLRNHDGALIEERLLVGLNQIVNPDIDFRRILVQRDGNAVWEIFFEDNNGALIALSGMGSGIKTVLLVLMNLVVRPVAENRRPSEYVFAFEELENNLHPALQRRLYHYIKKYSENHSAYFFLTTHSNVVIDTFSRDATCQLIHVRNQKGRTRISTVFQQEGGQAILGDLGIRASDILQSNGVIWVEGPSDRNFILRWLQLVSPDLKEGLHFSIMFYGGRLLSNLTFDHEWFSKTVIPLLKINRNAFVVLDRDGKNIGARVNATKERIVAEVGEGNYWITKGREIENYLAEDSITRWLRDTHNCKTTFKNDKNTKLEDNIAACGLKKSLKYNANKTGYSAEITEFLDETSLQVLDLREAINNLALRVEEWNR